MSRFALAAVTLLVAALLMASMAMSASAAMVVGKDGRVYACYKAGGKKKGSVRLVARQAHCRKGERKTSWSVTGPAGAPGAAGGSGAAGAAGPAGPAGSESKLVEVTNRLEALESTLQGVSNEALTKALATVNGITNAQLQETIGSLADVNALCTRVGALTTSTNALVDSLEDTVLGGVIPIGLELLIPGLPGTLGPFTCP